jgi:hypothetical protein
MLYNADRAPDPEAWLGLDESECIDLVRAYHRRTREPVGENAKVHAMAHVIWIIKLQWVTRRSCRRRSIV